MRALALLSLFFVSHALAQSTDDLERAKASWRAGAVAYTAGEYLPAIQAFEAAYARTPLSQIGFSLAQAHRRQYFVDHERSHLERAVELFRRYVQEVPRAGRSADALDALSQLEPLLGAPETAAPVRPVEARPTRLMITSDALDARISLDGAAGLPSPAIQEVAPGAHRVRVQAAGFEPNERVVTALPGELILSEVALRELPARVIVPSSANTELYVDGRFVSHGGQQATVSLSSGTHTLTLTRPGHRIAQRTVTLDRGETLPVQLPLEITYQRKVARALFGTVGLGVIAGAVCGGLSLHFQHDAQAFLRAQQRGAVSSARGDDYDRDVRGRNRARLAVGASFAAAAVIALAAVVTHQLDRPNLGEAQRRLALSTDGLVLRF